MRKKRGGAGGVVMLSAGMAWVPWIGDGPLVVLVSLLVFVAALAFCNRGEPTRRVIALVRAVKSPSSPPGRRDRRRAKPPASRSLGAGCGQLCWPSPCTPDPSPPGLVSQRPPATPPLVVGGHPSPWPPVSHHRGCAIRSSSASRASWEMVLPSRAATAAARSRRVAATRNAICGEVAVPDREGRPVARRTCSTMSSTPSEVRTDVVIQ